VLDSIESLPPQDREIVLLRGIEQLPYAVIAKKLGATEESLRVRFHRALRHLEASLPAAIVPDLSDR
jgi:RNA polymerase sigma factor (sigma-70 family)